MKSIFLFLFLIPIISLKAQSTINFESLLSEPDTFLNGMDGSEGFNLEGVFFPYEYNFEFDFWSGQWAVSTSTDDKTGNASNLYGAITGKGLSGQAYLIAQNPFSGAPLHFKTAQPIELLDVSITNTTYAYFVLRDGNQFSKAFGGVDGTDPDEFYLRWKGFLDGKLTDSLDFHLADFRFNDAAEDYILDNWTNCELSELGVVDSVTIEFFSTDVGQFGINTPVFFAMDDLRFRRTNQHPTQKLKSLKVYPNPAQDFLQWSTQLMTEEVILQSTSGQTYALSIPPGARQVTISHLPKGYYQIILQAKDGPYLGAFIKL